MHIVSAKYLFDGFNILENKAVIVDNNIIYDVVNRDELNVAEYKYLGDGIITAGFIDLQLNGCGGVLFNEKIDVSTLETMYQTCLRYGTLGFLPTLITSDFSDVIKALDVIKNWFEMYGNSRGVVGLHLEGPFIAVEKKGIHSTGYIIKPETKYLELIINYVKYFPIMMTIAVEQFSDEQIKHLSDAGIILSIGHSNATYVDAVRGFNNGIKSATHVFNAMSGLTGRNPGVVGAVLNTDAYAGVIADLLHVDSANIELLYKVKQDKLYIVTDAVTPMGTEIKGFNFVGKKIFVENGKCVDENGVIGGANITMNESIKNCVESCNISLGSALRMASVTPARVMCLDNSIGMIKRNYVANLIYMDIDNYSCTVL